MRKYFFYELKKNLFLLLGLTLSLLLLYFIVLITGVDSTYGVSAMLAITSGVSGAIAILVPILQFSYKMKKRSVDLYYSLPITHTKILIVKFLTGLLIIFIPYTICYFFGAAVITIKNIENIYAGYFFPHFFSTVIPLCFMYAISAFAFTRANNTLDGIIFIVMYAFAAVMVFLAIDRLTDYSSGSYLKSVIILKPYYIWSPLNDATEYFQDLIGGTSPKDYYDDYANCEFGTLNEILGYTIFSLMGIGSAVGTILFERKAKAENCQQVSQSIFGYKVLIPLYTVCALTLSVVASDGIVYVLLAAEILASFFMTVLYKRSLKIDKFTLIVLAASIVLGIFLGIIAEFATIIIAQ